MMPEPFSYDPQFNIWINSLKHSLAKRPVPNGHALDLDNDFLVILDKPEISRIANAPSVRMFERDSVHEKRKEYFPLQAVQFPPFLIDVEGVTEASFLF